MVPLQATLALWLIIQEPACQDALTIYAPRLLVALLCQVFLSTEQMPQEVNTFWRQCREQHGLPTHPNRCSMPVLSPSHGLGAVARAPSMTWALLCTQVCSADHQGPALPRAVGQ